MAVKTSSPAFKVTDTHEDASHGYAVWKRAKIEKGFEQSKDRASLIPADDVWRDLGLED